MVEDVDELVLVVFLEADYVGLQCASGAGIQIGYSIWVPQDTY